MHRRWTVAFALFAAFAVGSGNASVATTRARVRIVPVQAPVGGSARTPFAPFRVIGNIHYVGSSNAGSFLITTPEGHILIDTGYPQTESWVRESIEKVGFRVTDIKIILNTHAHADHVGGHAQFKEWTGAKVLTSEADKPVIADGGRSDFRSDGRELWKPLTADGTVRDRDEIRLGGVTLVPHLTPGHTKGNTTWTMVVDEGGRTYNVVFVGSMGLNRGVPLVGNVKYPRIAEDYAQSFAVLKRLPCDVFFAFHAAHYDLEEKKRRLDEGVTPNPFVDAAGFRAYIEKNERAFLDQLAKERGGLDQGKSPHTVQAKLVSIPNLQPPTPDFVGSWELGVGSWELGVGSWESGVGR